LVTIQNTETDMKKPILALGLVLLVATTACAQEASWPPAKQKESEFTGRKLDTFHHGSRKEWGYAEPQRDTFLVLHPKEKRSNAPLYVVLHSAGHDVHSCLACTTKVGNHDIYHSPQDYFALYLDCRANKGDWWWGIHKYAGPEVSPTDKRVIDTVLWVIKQYGVDENRVYLCGNSMGGSGTLGIGMRHGDVFAAIKANVPAEVKHVSSRMYFPPKEVPKDVTLPDPPIVVDYSAQNDGWSKGSAILLAGLNAQGPTVIHEPLPTRDHTERLLRACAADLEADGECVTLRPARLEPFGLRVPGDISSAAFFMALAAARPRWRVRCLGVGLNPGRTGILEVLTAMGARVEVEEGPMAADVEPQGDVVVTGAPLHGVTLEASMVPRCIDEIPVIAVVATQAEGRTEIHGAAELRHKESDRVAQVVAGLRILGVSVEERPDGLTIEGPARLRPGRLDAAGDHRLAMAWAVAASLVDPAEGACVIDGADVVAVSYPGFFEDLAALTS
jgi:pimeloyl-ACP methyl ester carboxylesterase